MERTEEALKNMVIRWKNKGSTYEIPLYDKSDDDPTREKIGKVVDMEYMDGKIKATFRVDLGKEKHFMKADI